MGQDASMHHVQSPRHQNLRARASRLGKAGQQRQPRPRKHRAIRRERMQRLVHIHLVHSRPTARFRFRGRAFTIVSGLVEELSPVIVLFVFSILPFRRHVVVLGILIIDGGVFALAFLFVFRHFRFRAEFRYPPRVELGRIRREGGEARQDRQQVLSRPIVGGVFAQQSTRIKLSSEGDLCCDECSV